MGIGLREFRLSASADHGLAAPDAAVGANSVGASLRHPFHVSLSPMLSVISNGDLGVQRA